MKVVEYWHGTMKNYRYDEDVSQSIFMFIIRGVIICIKDLNI